ncbi:MAG: hypothetical protein H6Q67_1871 [Firmicutes bacterium]|nr:hypothetical protein [Bacillota bacterium]
MLLWIIAIISLLFIIIVAIGYHYGEETPTSNMILNTCPALRSLAIKCNWNDAGYTAPCSNEVYEFNQKKSNSIWCSKPDCDCRNFTGEVTAKDYPCYESKLFVDYSFNITGSPVHIRQSNKGKLAILTTCLPTDREEDRFIFGYLFIDKIMEDENESIIYGDPTNSLKIDPRFAHDFKFWRYHQNTNTTKSHWGSGLFRNPDDREIYRFLCDLQCAYANLNGSTADLNLINKHVALYEQYINS